MSRYRGLVVADDLTGAADTGHEFAARGRPTLIRVGEDSISPSTAAVLVENTDSRECSPTTAHDRVERTLRDRTADVVYKKVDSTLRGNLASEVAAALSATEAALAVVAPAFPANGRTTVDGQQFVDGEPVADVMEGVASSHLPTLLSNAHPVTQIGIDVVSEGAETVRAALADALRAHADPPVVVCDGTHATHLAAVAAGTAALERRAIHVGSAGLARHVKLPEHDTTVEPGVDRDDPADGHRRVLGVVGSTNPRTLDQLAALGDSVVALDAAAALDGDTAKAVEDCDARFRDLDHVVVTGARSEADVARTLRDGRDRGLSAATIRDRVARALATTARALGERRALDGFVMTGGAVATTVLSALDADGLRLLGESVGSGVPVGRIVGGVADGALVVTKAGGFGERGILRTALRSVRDDEF